MASVYFIESLKNSKVYVGSTTKDPTDRLKQHNQGKNSWTKNNGPFKLIYYETYFCMKDARARESFYKSGFGKAIKKIIVDFIHKNNIGE